MRDQVYEVTFKRQMELLRYMLIIHGIIIFAYLLHYGFTFQAVLLEAYVFLLLFDVLPTIILHLQYLKANRNAIFVVREQQRTLSYSRNGEKFNYSFDDIEQIYYVAGWGNDQWYSFSDYRYFILTFKDGREILITCLMINFTRQSLERMFGKALTIKRRPPFPFIRKRAS
jgi:hypothetical protein